MSGRFFYIADKKTFLQDLQAGVIEDKLIEAIGHGVSDSEKSSWNNSLMYFGMAISTTTIPDETGIALELKFPRHPSASTSCSPVQMTRTSGTPSS